MISDKEIQQSAHAVIAHFGNGAMDHARRRIYELREGEDEAGALIWERIAAVIHALNDEQRSKGAH
jgi:hypothetical protein